jgi:hypothetical protein
MGRYWRLFGGSGRTSLNFSELCGRQMREWSVLLVVVV